MQSFPLISEQQKFPRGMKRSHMFEVKKKMLSAESTMLTWYSFYTVALMNVDFS